MSVPDDPSAFERIRSWLVTEIARRAGIPETSIDVNLPFATYRVDSMEGVNMAGALEDLLDMELEPTLIWDYPTIEKLARHLAELSSGQTGKGG
jgi:acyl carrier protein